MTASTNSSMNWNGDIRDMPMTDPTGDALRANEKVVEAVADEVADTVGSQLCFYGDMPRYCVRRNGFISRPCFCDAVARAAIAAYEKAMKGEG